MVALLSAKKLLLPVRGDAGDEEAFHLACTLAKQAKGKIYAIYVIEVSRDLPLDAEIGEETSRGESVLGHIEALAQGAKCPLEADILQARQAGPAILEEAVEKEADLIVLGIDCRQHIGNFPQGETTSYILQHSQCPVLLWRQGMAEQPPRG